MKVEELKTDERRNVLKRAKLDGIAFSPDIQPGIGQIFRYVVCSRRQL
jgi:hypothetical protein